MLQDGQQDPVVHMKTMVTEGTAEYVLKGSLLID